MTQDELKSFKRFMRHLSKVSGEGMRPDSPYLRGQRQGYRDAISAAELIARIGPATVEEIDDKLFG